ncbi:hypothetical protein [Kordia sp.]|uniref:hypothetical protein n=1 Tax=Kordia sp. TaxID=1965332 RepID=UPI0025C07B15|nr:hypothetical protein [Kordia sp.]MCH2193763.1 hypothetical protein [Kordia sp.]
MKTFASFFVVILLVFFAACKEKTTTIPAKKQPPKVLKDTVSPKVNSHKSEPKKIDLSSKLKEKVTRLASLKYNYQLKSLDTVIPKKSALLGSVYRIKALQDSVANAIDLKALENDLHQIHNAFLKGTKPMQPNRDTYPRATVEEYIFKTPAAAKRTYEMLIESKADGRLWMYISKSPYDLFVEENRIYFMRSGGFYMMDIYKNITEKIKG